jgi:hypothetical protein
VTEYQITSWRDLPSLVVARDGDRSVKVLLPQRFQEAIDEAAMRLGHTSSEAYLEGWVRSAWTPTDGAAADVAAAVAADLESRWPERTVASFLEKLGPAAEPV